MASNPGTPKNRDENYYSNTNHPPPLYPLKNDNPGYITVKNIIKLHNNLN